MREQNHSSLPHHSREGKPANTGRESGTLARIAGRLRYRRFRVNGITGPLLCVGPVSNAHTFIADRRGSSIVETAILVPILVLLLVGAVDYGRGFYASIEVSSAAESAAMYGTSNPLDLVGIQSMAQMDAKDIPTLNVSTSYGCECADGSNPVVSCATAIVCSSNAVRYVDVSTSATYTPLLPYPLIPSSFPLSGHSRMRMSN